MNCEGYRKLLGAVEQSEKAYPGQHNYRSKLNWAVERAKHYAEKTGLKAEEVLNAWESRRDYWFMNYYQAANQPLIEAKSVRVFDSLPNLLDAVGTDGFRCPACNGKSTDPYQCNSQAVFNGKTCNWKVFGLFRDLGKGITVLVKDKMDMERIFMPIAWEWPNSQEVQ